MPINYIPYSHSKKLLSKSKSLHSSVIFDSIEISKNPAMFLSSPKRLIMRNKLGNKTAVAHKPQHNSNTVDLIKASLKFLNKPDTDRRAYIVKPVRHHIRVNTLNFKAILSKPSSPINFGFLTINKLSPRTEGIMKHRRFNAFHTLDLLNK
jgi:hypothetical protein